MDDQIVGMITSRLDDLKNDLNTHFQTLVEGQRRMHDSLEDHIRSDEKNFSTLRVEIATTNATQDGVSTTKAKLWAGVGAGVAFIAGLVGDWIMTRRS